LLQTQSTWYKCLILLSLNSKASGMLNQLVVKELMKKAKKTNSGAVIHNSF